jgi:magnesium transporter
MASNQTSEVVKLLTMITVITTPVMIVGTWYGMNYTQQMPELNSSYGYYWALGLTAVSTVLTYLWFKKKKWF